MEFLAPWAGLTAAAIAVPAVVALYFLKLRRRPARVSTIQFWPRARDDVQANVPLRMIRPSVLLFLHLVILGLLLVALARPVLRAEAAATRRVLVLIDRSASMGARDAMPRDEGGPARTRLDVAKERGAEIVASLRRSVSPRQIGVIAFAAEPEGLAPMTASARAALDAIESIGPTDEPGNLAAALALVEALAGEAAAEEAAGDEPVTVYLIGDGSYTGGAIPRIAGARVLFERIGPEESRGGGAGVGAAGVGAAGVGAAGERAREAGQGALAAGEGARAGGRLGSVGNVGVVGLAARRDYGDPAMLRVFVEVLNATGTPATLPVSVSINGRTMDRRVLSVPAVDLAGAPAIGDGAGGGAGGAGLAATSAGAVLPGRASVVFEVPTVEGGIVVARVEPPTGEDVLSSDDAAAMVVSAARMPLIALVQPDARMRAEGGTGAEVGLLEDAAAGAILGSSGDEVASTLLGDALDEMRARGVMRWSASRYARLAPTLGASRDDPLATQGGGSEAASSADATPDMIVFDRVTPTVLPPVSSLHFGNVGSGGALAAIGVGESVVEGAGENVGGSRGVRGILLWDREHPVLRDATLDAVRIAGGRTLNLDAAAPGVVELARTSEGPVLASVDRDGVRRIVSSFTLAESNWPVQASFPIFLANAVDALTLRGDEQAGRAFTTGEPVVVRTTAGGGTVTLVPAGMGDNDSAAGGAGVGGASGGANAAGKEERSTRTSVSARAEVGERRATFGRIGRVGIYEAGGAASLERVVAVNLLDATESGIASPRDVIVDGVPARGIDQGSMPREIWGWFLIAAAALLALEWFVFAAKNRA
jgi:hypothetical protein